ncbi:MAG: hypothetical protein PHE73_08640 [Sulfurovaceae bacterium]|nr:hypothetical protein [Sulfurovaceae bacterium]
MPIGTPALNQGSAGTTINAPLGQKTMAGSIPVVLPSDVKTGIIDSGNSSTTPLGANGVFTGVATDALGLTQVSVTAFSDQNSATNGFSLQWSSDGTNWDHTHSDNLVANNLEFLSSGVHNRYYRIVYTNGTTPQSFFRLQVIQHTIQTPNLFTSVDKVISSFDHVQLFKGVVTGKTTAGGGAYVDVKVNPFGALTAAVTAADGDVFVRSNSASTFPVNVGTIGGSNISLGQQLAAASIPVVLTAAQITTLTPPAAITGFALETGGNLATIAGKDFATQTTLALIKAKTDNIPALGQALATASVPVVLTAAQLTTLTPPAAITGFALETGGNLATLAGAVSASKVNVNISSGSIANTSFASTIADGASVTLGAKADAKSTATDTTAVSIMSVLKEISAMEQAPASRAVTNAGTFAVQAAATLAAETTKVIGTVNIAASQTIAVTNTGTFAVQAAATLAAETTKVIGTINIAAAQTLATVTTVGAVTGITNALPAGTNLMGKVGIDQTTPGTTNAVAIAQIGATTVVNGGLAGSLSVGGTVATNVAITDNPVNIGAQGVSADVSAVTTTRKAQLIADLLGKLVVQPYALPQQLVSGATSDITNTTATTIIAGVASNYLYITHILVTNSHATVGTFVNITEETSGTVLYTGYAAAAGGGFSITLPTPLKVPTAAKALQATCVTTGSNTRVSAVGYKATI